MRNKEKIAAAYDDEEIVERICDSLNRHFRQALIIKTIPEEETGREYPLLIVADAWHSVNDIHFYVLRVEGDVYYLAFVEFVG